MKIALDQTMGAVVNLRTGSRWDAQRLSEAVARRSRAFAARGLRPGATAMICHGGDGEFFADLFAVWQTGARAACINPRSAPAEIENIANFLDPAIALSVAENPVPESLSPIAAIGADLEHGTPDDAPLIATSMDDDALILFTSGTTGIPKGVVHTFRSLSARVSLNRAYIGDVGTRTLCVLPTHFGHGLIGNCLTPLFASHEVALAAGTNLDVIANLGDLIDTHQISFMSSVPTFWKKVLRSANPPTAGTLERLHMGSAPLSAELWETVAEWAGTRDVVNMYGITETANWIAGASLSTHAAADGLVGTMWGGNAQVIRDDGTAAPMGEGQLIVQTPTLMRAYLDQPKLTAEVMRDGWYHTGDNASIQPDGTIILGGRQKYEINRAGIKVQPEDVDLALERHPGIAEACTFAISDSTENQLVGVAVVLEPDAELGVRDLRQWCRDQIAPEKHPQRWFIIDEIPKTDRGKINRKDVEEFCLVNADAYERRR